MSTQRTPHNTYIADVQQDLSTNILSFTYTGPKMPYTETVWFQLLDSNGEEITAIERDQPIGQAVHTLDVGQISANKPWTLVCGPHSASKKADAVAASAILNPGSFTGTNYQGTMITLAQLTLKNASVTFIIPNLTTLTSGQYGYKQLTQNDLQRGTTQLDVSGLTANTNYQIGLYIGTVYRICSYSTNTAQQRQLQNCGNKQHFIVENE